MPIGNNGDGIWSDDSVPSKPKCGVSVDGNILSMVGDAALTPKFSNGGRASAGNTISGSSPDQGSGPANQPSPSANTLGRANTNSPDQGSGPANKPSPDANLINSNSEKSASNRPSSFGGVEKGVQIQ